MAREICSMARAVQFLHHLRWAFTKWVIYTGWWFQRVNMLLIYGYIYGYIYSTIFGLNSTIFMTTSQEIILFKPHYLLIWLVASIPLKNMSSSVGIVLPNTWKHKKMFQTTNQYTYIYIYIHTLWLFKIAMENGPFIDVFLMICLFKVVILQFATLNNQGAIHMYMFSELTQLTIVSWFFVPMNTVFWGKNNGKHHAILTSHDWEW